MTYSIILPSTIKVFLMVPVLWSRNENEIKIWIRGHTKKRKISRVVILISILRTDLFYDPTKYHLIFQTVVELCSRNENDVKY